MSSLSRINTNVSALKALQNLNSINTQMAMRQLRLTTGKQINDPSDNPAGWTIATKMRTRADGLGQALANISSSKDMIAVAEGHLQNVQSILEDMRIKAEEAANDTLGETERNAILNELKDFNAQIEMEVAQAQWNGQALLNGSSDFTFQIGADVATSDKMDFNIAKDVYGGTSVTFDDNGLGVVATTYSSSGIQTSTQSVAAIFGTVSVDAANAGTMVAANIGGHFEIKLEMSSSTQADVSIYRNGSLVKTVSGVGVAGAGAGGTNIALGTSVGLVTSYGGATVGINTIGITALGTTTLSFEAGDTFNYGFDVVEAGNSVSSADNARTFMDSVDNAIDRVSEALSYTGAITNRLTYQETSLTTARTRTEAARSNIEDADMAYEQLEATKLTILQQTATAMLAQANMAPQNILSLFG